MSDYERDQNARRERLVEIRNEIASLQLIEKRLQKEIREHIYYWWYARKRLREFKEKGIIK